MLLDGDAFSTGLKALSISPQNKGLIYYEQAEFEKAINYYIKALEIKEKLNSPESVGMLINNIGLVYYYQGGLIKDKKTSAGLLSAERALHMART